MIMVSDTAPRSLLGDIVRETYRFVREGRASPNHIVRSPVNEYQDVLAKDYFKIYGKNNQNFAVKQARLPQNFDVKAVHYHNSRVVVETSRVDFEGLGESLRESNVPVEIKGKSAYIKEEKIIKSLTQDVGRGETPDIRTVMWLLPDQRSRNSELAIRVLDTLEAEGNYLSNADLGSLREQIEHARDPRLRLVLQQRMEQELQIAQRARLILSLQGGYRLARRIALSKILRMNNPQLAEHLRREAAKNPVIDTGE